MENEETKQMALNYPGFVLPQLRGFLQNTIWQRYGKTAGAAVEKTHDLLAEIAALLGYKGHYQAGFDIAKNTNYEHLRLHRPDQAADFTRFMMFIQLYKNEYENTHPLPYTAGELKELFSKTPNQYADEPLRALITKYLEDIPDTYRISFKEFGNGYWEFAIAIPGKKVSTVIRLTRASLK